jgi:hypothetical protein
MIKSLSYHLPFNKNFASLIKFYLKRYFIIYEKDKENQNLQTHPFEYLIEDFTIISSLLKGNAENNFWTDFFTYLIKHIFDSPHSIYANYTSNSLSHSKSPYLNIDYKMIFYENFDKVNKF